MKLIQSKIGTDVNWLFSIMASTFFLLLASNLLAETQFGGALKSVSITDIAGINRPPTAIFTYAPDGESTTFDASDSADEDGNISEYYWDFGDGSSGSGMIVNHKYLSMDNISVTLTTIDNDGGIMLTAMPLSNTASCTNLGTWDIYWDGDHTDGFDDYCLQGDTTGQWTVTDGPSAIEVTCPTGQTGNCLKIDEEDEHLSKSPTGFFDSTQGTIKFDVYSGLEVSATVFEGRKDSNEEFYIQLNANGAVRFQFEDPANGSQYLVSTNTVTASTWTTVTIGWRDGNQYIKLDSGVADTETMTWPGYDSEPTTVYWGMAVYALENPNGIYVKNIYMKDTYEAP